MAMHNIMLSDFLLVGMPMVKHINTNLCCYISLRSQHYIDFKSADNFFASGGSSRLNGVDV